MSMLFGMPGQLLAAGLSFLEQRGAHNEGLRRNAALQRAIENQFNTGQRRYENYFGGLTSNLNTAFNQAQNRIGQPFTSLGNRLSGGASDLSASLDPQYAQRTNDVLGMLRSGTTGVQQGYGALGRGIGSGFQELGARSGAGFGALSGATQGGYMDLGNRLGGGYQERLNRGLSNLQGMGDQAKKDINRDYQGFQSRVGQDLVSRGLSASTVSSTLRSGVERERQAAVERLNENIRNERLNLDARLSGDQLAAQERLGVGGLQSGANIGLAGLQTGANIGLSGLGTLSNIGMTGLNSLNRNNLFGTGLAADLSGQRLGVQNQLGQLGLNYLAQAGLAGAGAQSGVEMGRLGSLQNLGNQRLNFIQNLMNARTGQLNSINIPAPASPSFGQSLLAIMQAKQAADAAKNQQSSGSVWGPAAISGGSGIASAGILAAALA